MSFADCIPSAGKLVDMLSKSAGKQCGSAPRPTRPEFVDVLAKLIADLAGGTAEQQFKKLRERAARTGERKLIAGDQHQKQRLLAWQPRRIEDRDRIGQRSIAVARQRAANGIALQPCHPRDLGNRPAALLDSLSEQSRYPDFEGVGGGHGLLVSCESLELAAYATCRKA